MRFLFFVSLCVHLLWTVAATAQDRHALVVGIDDYVNITDLQKARNDAEAVGAALGETGFEVTVLLDANRRDLFRALNAFVQRLEPGDEAVFYFAGHGVEVEGRNYLLPTDVPAMRPGEERLLTSESLAADDVLADMQASGARVSLLILDACRDNPFPQDGTRSLGRNAGLARLEAPEGAFIMFSAGTGQTALDRLSNDDPNPNSVFTRALLPLLSEPNLPIHQIARRLRRDVQDLASSVGYSQRPAYYDEVTGDFFFVEGDRAPIVEVEAETEPEAATEPQIQPVDPDPVPPTREVTSVMPCDAARTDWALVEGIASEAVLQAYLDTHTDCAFMAAMAADRLATLQEVEPEPVVDTCASAGIVWGQLSVRPEFQTIDGIVLLGDYVTTYGDCAFYATLASAQIETLVRQEEESRAPQHVPRPAGSAEVCTTSTGSSGAGVGQRSFCASSALAPQGSNSYWPSHMFDGNTSTAWNEGASGNGIGQTLAWVFDTATPVSRLQVVNGYTKTARTFSRNGRVRQVRVTGSTGFERRFEWRDSTNWQTFELGDIEDQMWVQIEILSTYPGTHYADTAVTELRIE